CGFVAGCPNCSISLTYHRKVERLICHICGHNAAAPKVCPEPNCRNPAIRFAGVGTEKVEDALAKLFPHARIARMDSDSLKRNEEKVARCAEQIKKELEKELSGVSEHVLAGPAPAPLLKAENFFRYQIMIRAKSMPKLSRYLATMEQKLKMPEDVSMTIDIDP